MPGYGLLVPRQLDVGAGHDVLRAGAAKTGTKSMVEALHRLGFAAYHSEDFFINIWTGLADEFWRAPENGGCTLASGLCPRGVSDKNMVVLNRTSPERLAKAISQCGVEAMAFDVIDRAWWPIYDTSPGAKVVSMSWRTYDEYSRSRADFHWLLLTAYWYYGMLVGAPLLLPYNVILVPLFDLLSGGDITKWLSTGQPAPALAEEGVARKFFRQSVGCRRWFMNMVGGMDVWYDTREAYDGYFEEARRRIPPERLLEWDMRRHTMRDLCDFLGIAGHPQCEAPGTLPKVRNLFHIEALSPYSVTALLPLYLALHFLNWHFLNLVCGACSCCPCLFPPRRRSTKME